MKAKSIPIDQLHEDPANARRHPDRNLDAIKASLARFGQQTPLVIDAKNIVRKGNGTLLAARALGMKSLWCVPTALAGVDATAYAIADNRTSELAEWDDQALAETLEAIRSEPDFPIEATGFTDDEIGKLLEGIGRKMIGANGGGETVDDPAGEWQGMPEFEHKDLTGIQAVVVHFKTREDVNAFAELISQKITDKTKFIWYPEAEIIRYGDAY